MPIRNYHVYFLVRHIGLFEGNINFIFINTKKYRIYFCDEECFSLTFEANGFHALESIHSDFIKKEIKVGEIENRGHTGKNFVFYDLDGNKFDVWSELSPIFKEKYLISQ